MKLKKTLVTLSSVFALANGYAEPQMMTSTCPLGTTCSLSTNVVITPQTGAKYRCTIKHDVGSGSLRVWVHSDDAFIMTTGKGLHTFDTDSYLNTIMIEGMFKNTTSAAIKFRRLWGKGTVTCAQAF